MKKNKGLMRRDVLATDLILRQIAPLPVQPIGQDTGLIKGAFENWKLEQRAKSTALISQIARDQAETTKAHAESMMTMMTFSHDYYHKITRDQAITEHHQEMAKEMKLKNYLLQIECKKAEFEFNQMTKDDEDGTS